MQVNCVIDGEYIRLVTVHKGHTSSSEIHISRPEALAATIRGAYDRGYEDGRDDQYEEDR